MQTNQRYGGLNVFRMIAAILVVAIHTSPFLSLNADIDFFFTRILGRIAVPFFFMITGQFVVSDFIMDKKAKGTTLRKHLKKLWLYYGMAIAIYIPIGIYSGQYGKLSPYDIISMLFFDGTFYHLWYFSACIIGILLIYALSRFLSLSSITVIAGILYLFGLLGDSYYGFLSNVPVMENLYSYIFQVFSYTRNGLFYAPIFLILGIWVSSKEKQYSMGWSIIGLVVSFLAMTLEGFLLHIGGLQRHDSMYIMLIPTMIFLYQLLLQWKVHAGSSIRSITTWIYILHPAMIIVVRALGKLLHFTSILVDNSLIHYVTVTILSILASYLIVKLTSKQPKKFFLKDRAWIEIDRTALAQNVRFLQSKLPETCVLMPAVKAQAYGHGAFIVSKELNKIGIYAFCVACIDEGIQLRKDGIKGEILILGYTHPDKFSLLKQYHLTQTVVDYDYAKSLNNYGKKLHVHLGIDTGMHRLGVRCENIDMLCSIFEMPNLRVDGLFTHLSTADTLLPKDMAFTEKQATEFYDVIEILKSKGYTIPKLHLQSSYSILNYPEFSGDYARVGIALYGILSTKEDTLSYSNHLTPVLSLKARVACVRPLYENEPVGYGMAFTAPENMKIATITIGYADGLPRNLSNGTGYVLIHGKKAPIIGRICMDQTIVDVSHIPNIQSGDIAIIIGTSEKESISAADLAEQTNSISNEILCRLGQRLPQILI